MSISIWQIQYNDDVVGTYDPDFLRYDCRDQPEWQKREMAHMLRFYDESIAPSRLRQIYNKLARGDNGDRDCFGLVSPKFFDKVGISGRDFLNWIEANPGHDVYFINPFPQLAYCNFNVWTQGERWHPGLANIANTLFATANYPIKVEKLPRNTNGTALYSNYWVGTRAFWSSFMSFVRGLDVAVTNLDDDERKAIFSLAPHYASATYFPFVFERLFSTFLLINEGIKSLPYPYERVEILSRCDAEIERLIIREWGDRIDAWDNDGRNDDQYRRFFGDLSSVLVLYGSIPHGSGSSVETGASQSDEALIDAPVQEQTIPDSLGLEGRGASENG